MYTSLPANQFEQQIPNTTLIDIRTPGEIEHTGIIPGAIHMDIQSPEFMSQLQELKKDNPYLLYCHSGNRTTQVLQIMNMMGFNNISDLQGGITQWIIENKPLTPWK